MATTESGEGHERLATNHVPSAQVSGAEERMDGESMETVSEPESKMDIVKTEVVLSEPGEDDGVDAAAAAEKQRESQETKREDTEEPVEPSPPSASPQNPSPSPSPASTEKTLNAVSVQDGEPGHSSESGPTSSEVKTEEDSESELHEEKVTVKDEDLQESSSDVDTTADNADKDAESRKDVDTEPEQEPEVCKQKSVSVAADDLDEMMDIGTVDQMEQEAQMKVEEETTRLMEAGTSPSPATSNTVSVNEDSCSLEEETDVKPTVLPAVDMMQSSASPSSEVTTASTGRDSSSPAAMMNGMKVVKLSIPRAEAEKQGELRPIKSSPSPPLVKVKDEPIDEEYEQALISSTSASTASVKDEPNTAKEDLRIGSVFSVTPTPRPQMLPVFNPPSATMSCSHCKKSLLKGQTAFQRMGSPALFCTTACLTTSLPNTRGGTKICNNCHKVIFRPQDVILAPDAKGAMKEFCSENCLTSFNFKKNSNLRKAAVTNPPSQPAAPQSLCSMCTRYCVSKHEVILSGAVHKMCSDACFNRFRTVNNLAMAGCANCGSYCHNKPIMLKMEDSSKTLCNAECLSKFKEKTKVSLSCTMCRTTRLLAEMVDNKNNDDTVNLFCSSSCVMAFKVQTVSASGARLNCDTCGKNTVPAYHLAMSDTSIRNFCMLPCVMAFQEKFKKSQKHLNVFTKLPLGSTQVQMLTPGQMEQAASKQLQLQTMLSCAQCTSCITSKPEVVQIKSDAIPKETQQNDRKRSAAFDSDVEELKAAKRRMIDSPDSTPSEVGALKIMVKCLLRQVHRLEDRADGMERKNKHLEDRVNILEKENKHLEDRVNIMEKENKHLQTRLNRMESENKHLEDRVNIMESENEHLETSGNRMESENEHLETSGNRMESENEHLETSGNRMESENEHLETSGNRMESENEHLETSGNRMESENEHLETSGNRMGSENKHLEDRVNMEKENKHLEDRVNIMESENEHLETSGNRMESENEHLETSGNRMESENEHLESCVNWLENVQKELENDWSRIKSENKHLEDKLNSMSVQKHLEPSGSRMESENKHLEPSGSREKRLRGKRRRGKPPERPSHNNQDKLVFVCNMDCSLEYKKANYVTSLCEYCKIEKITRDAKRINNRDCFFCSDGCKLLFRHELTMNWGKHCQSCVYCHCTSKKQVTAQYGGSTEEFCSEECRSRYTMLFCHVAKCDTCGQKGKLKESLPLLGEVKHFCDLGCLLQFCCNKVTTQGEVFKAGTPVIANVISLAGPPTGKSNAPDRTAQQSSVSNFQSKNFGHISIQTDPVKALHHHHHPPPPAPAPKILKNKALMCRPLVQNKGVSCKTQTSDAESQTDDAFPKIMVVPIPVPVFVPVPMNMYSQCTPKPVGLPLPLPVPMFLPVTMDSAERIVETIQEIKEKIPSDPFEAELILMAEMVAEQEEKNDKTERQKESVMEKQTERQEAAAAEDHVSNYSDDLDTDDLASFLNNWEEASSDASGLRTPSRSNTQEKLNAIVDVPMVSPSEPQSEPPPPGPPPMDVEADFTVETLEKMAKLREQSQHPPSPPPAATTSRRRQAHRKAREKRGRKPQRASKAAEPTPQKGSALKAAPVEGPKLKSEYGVDAWKRWIQWRKTQPNLEKPRFSRPMELKEDVLRCTTAELSYGLCCFITEVKRPNGEPYSPDSLFYLCLGIQQYLFENGRVENIFMDRFYNKFSTEFTTMLRGFKPSIMASGYIHSRVEEDFLWDCKQLGAYSPIVLLNTLLFFCCKYFGFSTVEQHRQLSFAHVMRCTKSNPNNTKTTFLRFYPPISITEPEPDPEVPAAKKRKEEESKEDILEMMENTENPLRCPVRLYEFYLSKCSESVKQRTNLFYLHPERCCVPNSPLWFSSAALDDSTMEAMLTRILTVRELHLRTRKEGGAQKKAAPDPPFTPDKEDEEDSE